MARRNAGPASSPNSVIDLTSLLDVIFILLFIIIMAYAQASQALKDEKIKIEQETLDAQAAQEAYQQATEQLENVGERVLFVTVYCTYSESDPSLRSIQIVASNNETESFEINEKNESTTFTRLKNHLETMIDNNKEKTIFIDVNTEQILRRDYEAIDRIIQTLEEEKKVNALQ